MKLESLKLEDFGALKTRNFEFLGRSAVIYGKNEAGKTTFLDAAMAAIFGPPKTSSVFGRKYLLRYGTAARAEAELSGPDGKISVSSDAPLSDTDDFPPELFKTLLVIRCGETDINHEERNFMESFTSRVLGGGQVHISRAMSEIYKIYSSDRRNRWHIRWSETQEELDLLRVKLHKADDIDEAMRAKHEYSGITKTRKEAREKLEEKKKLRALERTYSILSGLRKLQSELSAAEREIDGMKGIDRNAYASYCGLNEQISNLQELKHEKNTLIDELEKSIAAHKTSKAEAETALAAFPPEKLRADAREAAQACNAAAEVLAALSIQSSKTFSFLTSTAGVAAGIAVAALGFYAHWPLWSTALGAACAAVLVFGGVTAMARLVPANEQAETKAEKTREAYTIAAAKLGDNWKNIEPQEFSARLTALENEITHCRAKGKTITALIEQQETRAAGEIKERDAIASEYAKVSEKLAAELKKLSLSGMDEFSVKLEKLDFLGSTVKDLERRLRLETGITGDLKPELEHKLEELAKETEKHKPSGAPRPIRDIETDISKLDREIQSVSFTIEQDQRALSEIENKLARLEGELGRPMAELATRERLLEYEIKEIKNWREAAEATHQLLAEISKATDEMMQ
ncbi:MAG: AAA family ATPase, partial [Elusimicrobiaceae bacterium]